MGKIVECVPNFSEGRNKKTIKAIADAIEQTKGCRLLDVDPGKSTNRCVYTFVGSPEAVLQGAINSAKVAKQKIDMAFHKGEHHRMGALDVCPFILLADSLLYGSSISVYYLYVAQAYPQRSLQSDQAMP